LSLPPAADAAAPMPPAPPIAPPANAAAIAPEAMPSPPRVPADRLERAITSERVECRGDGVGGDDRHGARGSCGHAETRDKPRADEHLEGDTTVQLVHRRDHPHPNLPNAPVSAFGRMVRRLTAREDLRQ